MTTCEWREEYACYKPPVGICEVQNNGQCGWTETDELKSCLLKSLHQNDVESPDTIELEVI